MIRSITINNYINDPLTISLANSSKTGLALMNIDGLEPAKADINTNNYANSDGSEFISARLTERNIVLTFKLLALPTIEQSRYLVYRYFPSKRKVTLTIQTDTRKANIDCYVENIETEHFSKNTQAQVSLICPDPLFYDASSNGNKKVYFYYEREDFEFPVEFTDGGIQFGSIIDNNVNIVNYNGENEIGVQIVITAHGNAENVSVSNQTLNETISINTETMRTLTGNGIISGDQITIDTRKRKKSVILLRNGQETNLLNCLGRNINWLTITRGDNIFSYEATSGASNLNVVMNYQNVYEGM